MDNDKKSLGEKFETVHQHLDIADRTLASLTRELHEEINNVVDDTEVDIEYDLDTGSFQAHLPVDEITARINRRLDPPFVVRAEGTKLVIEDIRRSVDMEIVEQESRLTGREYIKGIKGIISSLEESYEVGAPLEETLTLLEYSGMTREKAEHEIDKLKQKGEVYEPATDVLRTT